MVGGTIRRKVIHRESFRASVLHLSEIQAVLQSIAAKKSVLTTPSLLSKATRRCLSLLRMRHPTCPKIFTLLSPATLLPLPTRTSGQEGPHTMRILDNA